MEKNNRLIHPNIYYLSCNPLLAQQDNFIEEPVD